MDKTNIYNSNQPTPLFNTPPNATQSYENKNNSSFTKIDSASLINQQPYLNYNQTNYPNPASNIAYKGSLQTQQSQHFQPNGTQVVANISNKSTMVTGEQKYKNKYSFKRNTVSKSALVSDAKTGRVQQPATVGLRQQKIQNNTYVFQNKDTTGNTLNLYTNQTSSNISTARPGSNAINNIQSTYILTPLNVIIPPPSPIRPTVTPLPTKPTIIPGNPQPVVIPQPQPTIIPSQPQPQPIIVPSQPQPGVGPFVPQTQPNIKPSQPQPVINPVGPQPQPIIIPQPTVVNPLPPHISVVPVPVQPKPSSVTPPPVNPVIIPEFVDKSQQYIKQIRELRIKIEELEAEKFHLIDQVRYYERQRFQSGSQQTLRVYKEQIQTLKQRIAQISASVPPPQTTFSKNDRQIEQLKEKLATYINREKQYEYQLIQAQNHIIYLQNNSKSKPSVSSSHQNFENQIKQLRQTIANYTEHIQHIQMEKEQYKKYIIGKDQELTMLYQQNNSLNTYLQQQKGPQNGIDPNEYYSLLAQFGKKDLQVIMLMQENSRLQKEASDTKGFLVKAQDYIIQLQQQLHTNSSGVQVGQVDNSRQLQVALEKERQNQASLKYSYEAEILKLNNLNKQLSKQIKIYETEIGSLKNKTSSSDSSKIAELNKKIQIYQTEINNYKLEIQKINNINVQLTQQINVYKTEISNYVTQINEITHKHSGNSTTAVQGVDPKVKNELLLQYGRKQLQTIILLEQISRLNALRVQLTNHLQSAQDYIFSIQQHVKVLEAKIQQLSTTKTYTTTSSNSEVEGLRLRIKDLQGKLAISNQKIAIVETKQATHFKEVEALQLKYKGIISQLDKNYNQLLSQKNSLAQKIVDLSNHATKVSTVNLPNQKSLELQQTNKQLNIQLAEITEHLVRAESFIKMNSQRWQKGHLIEKELSEKTGTLQLLNKEIQLIKDQNVRLNDTNVQLQKTIQELTNSKTNSQNMTIVITEKEQVQVLEADRHAQIQQLELSLANYTTLYNQSQAKLELAQKQIQNYKEQIKKFAELEGFLRKAEQFISEQELKWNTTLKNYETQNLQIKNHLMGAQVYIKELEERLNKLNNDFIKIQQQNKAHVKENHEILQALNKAQKHIFQMEKLIKVK